MSEKKDIVDVDSAWIQVSLYSAVQTISGAFVIANTTNNFMKLAKQIRLFF